MRALIGLLLVAIVAVIWALQPAPQAPVADEGPAKGEVFYDYVQTPKTERDSRRPLKRLSGDLPRNFGAASATHKVERGMVDNRADQSVAIQGPELEDASDSGAGGVELPKFFKRLPNPIIRDEENANWKRGDRTTDGSLVVPRVQIDIVKNNIRRYYNNLPGNKKLPEKIVADEVLPPSILKALNMPENSLITMMGDYDAQDIRGWEQAINMPEEERSNIGVMFLKPSGEEMRRYLFTFPVDGKPYGPTSPPSRPEDDFCCD